MTKNTQKVNITKSKVDKAQESKPINKNLISKMVKK